MDSILHVELKIMSRVVYRHFSFMTLYASYFNNFNDNSSWNNNNKNVNVY